MILGIDPGNEVSHGIVWDGNRVIEAFSLTNEEMRHYVQMFEGVIAIEKVTPSKPRMFNPKKKAEGQEPQMIPAPMPQSVLDTAVWIGRFIECARGKQVHLIKRKDVRQQICQHGGAKDADIRRAIIDRYGEPMVWQEMKDGDGNTIVKKSGPEKGQSKREHVYNPIYGQIVGDQWQAFGVALTAWETIIKPEMSYLKQRKGE